MTIQFLHAFRLDNRICIGFYSWYISFKIEHIIYNISKNLSVWSSRISYILKRMYIIPLNSLYQVSPNSEGTMYHNISNTTQTHISSYFWPNFSFCPTILRVWDAVHVFIRVKNQGRRWYRLEDFAKLHQIVIISVVSCYSYIMIYVHRIQYGFYRNKKHIHQNIQRQYAKYREEMHMPFVCKP